MKLYNCEIPFVALENPVGWMNTAFRKPNQILRPYYFGEPHQKKYMSLVKRITFSYLR